MTHALLACLPFFLTRLVLSTFPSRSSPFPSFLSLGPSWISFLCTCIYFPVARAVDCCAAYLLFLTRLVSSFFPSRSLSLPLPSFSLSLSRFLFLFFISSSLRFPKFPRRIFLGESFKELGSFELFLFCSLIFLFTTFFFFSLFWFLRVLSS